MRLVTTALTDSSALARLICLKLERVLQTIDLLAKLIGPGLKYQTEASVAAELTGLEVRTNSSSKMYWKTIGTTAVTAHEDQTVSISKPLFTPGQYYTMWYVISGLAPVEANTTTFVSWNYNAATTGGNSM